MKYLVASLVLLGAGIACNAQITCPPELVCISRQAAQKAVVDGERVIAQEAELTTLKGALEAQKGLTQDALRHFAEVSGENSALKQNAVQDRAIITILLQTQKKKCFPFSICIGG